MESPIIKLKAAERELRETKCELACMREKVNNAKEEIEFLKRNAKKGCEKEEKTFPHYLRKEARIITEVQEALADEIKTRLSTGACTREVTQLTEVLAKLTIKE